MTAPPTDPVARIDAQIADAQRRLDQARSFRREVDALRGEASSRDGVVSVAVDATGLVRDLQLHDPLPPARDLQRVVLETLREAQRQVAARASAAAADRFGETSPVTTRMRAELTERFGPDDDAGRRHGDLGPGGRWLQ